MIIVIGILVDDGIVIAENIYQHYERGKTPIQAAIDGTMEVIPPIVSAIINYTFGLFNFFISGRSNWRIFWRSFCNCNTNLGSFIS